MLRLLAAVALILAVPAPAQTATGPDSPTAIVPRSAAAGATLPTSALRIHDPWIVADKTTQTYHLFTRNDPLLTGDQRPGIMVYSSRDLRLWQTPHLVFALPEGTWADAGAWAPEVHFWRGSWVLFATFHNEKAIISASARRPTYRRATMLAASTQIDGSYHVLRNGAPPTPIDQMTLDGTLHVDRDGKPWMVYAHEWIQTGVGTIEAVPLTDDLAPAGAPRLLFRANEAAWVVGQRQSEGDTGFVTDGPELFRTKTGTLLMLWSSYGEGGYVQALARSRSGTIAGPWEQLGPLVERDSGHGMLFTAFDGRLMMVLHRPFKRALAKFYEMRDTGDRIEVVREAVELDGEAWPTHGCPPGRDPMLKGAC